MKLIESKRLSVWDFLKYLIKYECTFRGSGSLADYARRKGIAILGFKGEVPTALVANPGIAGKEIAIKIKNIEFDVYEIDDKESLEGSEATHEISTVLIDQEGYNKIFTSMVVAFRQLGIFPFRISESQIEDLVKGITDYVWRGN